MAKLGFLGSLAGVALIVGLGSAAGASTAQPAPDLAPPSLACRIEGWTAASEANAASLTTLLWRPFGREEVGWEIYAPLIQREIATTCPVTSEGFAAALAAWQSTRNLPGDGVLSEGALLQFTAQAQARRPFVAAVIAGVCPETPDLITEAARSEGTGGKTVWMQPGALRAWRAMAAAARAEVPGIAADPDALTIFSGYRSPSLDAARCLAEGNCDGVVRARCSAHRTGLAADLYVGHAQGYSADSTADENRLFMTRTATYRWLVANATRFGFVNYAFEPWHWEWTGETP